MKVKATMKLTAIQMKKKIVPGIDDEALAGNSLGITQAHKTEGRCTCCDPNQKHFWKWCLRNRHSIFFPLQMSAALFAVFILQHKNVLIIF